MICVLIYATNAINQQSLTKNPKLSIAAGVDFGFYKRFVLIFPNSFEHTISSAVGRYHKIMKIFKNNHIRSDFTYSKIIGHCIAFGHDASTIANDLFDKVKISKFIKIHFVGSTENDHDT